jgi:hypothetical protein
MSNLDRTSLAITAHFTIRDRPEEGATVRLEGIEQLVGQAKILFTNFEERNPWICRDSLHGRVFVIVDAALPGRNSAYAKEGK